jgi:hypothetical protein
MTYQNLLDQIKTFTESQLKQTVTIYIREMDEYYAPVSDYPLVESDTTCDQLDSGHKYLVI